MANFRPPASVAHLSNYFGQSTKNEPIWKFYNYFLYKMKIEKGLFLTENCQNMYLGPHNAGRFGQMGVSANWPNSARFQNFTTISCTKSKLKGGLFH